MTTLQHEMARVIEKHRLGESDVHTMAVNFFGRPTQFQESGSRTVEAAHHMADQRGTAIARAIDAKLTPKVRELKFDRLLKAYDLLREAGVEIDE